MNAPLRLTPEMTSRKLQALGWIRRYIARHHGSPTYGEIAAGLGVSKDRARDLVRSLERAGKLERERGARRGIRLVLPDGVDTIDAAIELLRERGFRIDEEGLGLSAAFPPPTYTPLPMLPALEHIPDVELDGADDDGARAAAG